MIGHIVFLKKKKSSNSDMIERGYHKLQNGSLQASYKDMKNTLTTPKINN